MRRALDLVKTREADACVSAGNTGALMAISRFVLRMMDGIERPAIAAQLRKLGLDPSPSTPEEAARFMRSENEKWGNLIRKIGLTGE